MRRSSFKLLCALLVMVGLAISPTLALAQAGSAPRLEESRLLCTEYGSYLRAYFYNPTAVSYAGTGKVYNSAGDVFIDMGSIDVPAWSTVRLEPWVKYADAFQLFRMVINWEGGGLTEIEYKPCGDPSLEVPAEYLDLKVQNVIMSCYGQVTFQVANPEVIVPGMALELRPRSQASTPPRVSVPLNPGQADYVAYINMYEMSIERTDNYMTVEVFAPNADLPHARSGIQYCFGTILPSPTPTNTVVPSPTPTNTAEPTETSSPTNTVVPTETTPATEVPTATPIPNGFTLISANRACADQRFSASWTGSNLQTVEFALSNTSDEWTSGWMNADAASGTFSAPVDHHGYDKVIARATFTDGSTAQQDADVGTCTEAPAPPAPQPTAPAPSKPAPSQPGGVTNLPKTGSGDSFDGVVMPLMLIASGLILAGLRWQTVRRERP